MHFPPVAAGGESVSTASQDDDMTRNSETGTTPPDVNFTLADSIFSQEQNQHIWQIAQHMERLDVKLLDSLIAFGKTLEAWLTGHPLEDTARRVLLAPLHADGVELAKLLRRVQTRLLMSAPAKSQEQFDAAINLQMQDAGVGAAVPDGKADGAGDGDAAIADAKALVAQTYAVITASMNAMMVAVEASRYRAEYQGGMTAMEKSAQKAMKDALKKCESGLAFIQTWRFEQARREEAKAGPAA